MRIGFLHWVSGTLALGLFVFLRNVGAQSLPADYAQHFSYDKTAALDEQTIGPEGFGGSSGVSIQNFSYAGAGGARVPASLVTPKEKGKHPAILWGHWLMPGSSMANRQEFRDEAILLARCGVVSLLIDAPQARPGFKPAPNPALMTEQVIDLKRAVDYLSGMSDVDSTRIGYVGHSWDSGAGAILDAVDKRVAAFVFMSGPQSNLEYVLHSDSPRMVEARKKVDVAKVEQQMRANAWADPGAYAPFMGPAPALLQYGLKDEEWVPIADAKNFVAGAAGSKEVKFYDADHALNADARRDRIAFLARQLKFAPPSASVIASVPQIR